MPVFPNHHPPQQAPRVIGVELGGTKVIMLVADGPTIVDRHSFPTTTAARQVLIGGGVGVSRPHLLTSVRQQVVAILAGYLPWVDATTVADIVRVAGLGEDAGPLGAVALGLAALGR